MPGTLSLSYCDSIEGLPMAGYDCLVLHLWAVRTTAHSAVRKMLTCVSDRRPVMSGRLLTGESP